MTLESAAYVSLVGSVSAVPFSLPLARALFGMTFILLVVHLVREKRRPLLPVVGGLALAFVLVAAWATLFGLNPREGLKDFDKLAWFIAIPITATLVSSSRRLTRMLRGYGLGTLILCARLLAKAWQTGRQAVAAGRVDAGWEALCRGLKRTPDVDHDFWWALMDTGDITGAQLLMLGMVVSVGFIFMAIRNRSRTGWLWACALLLQFAVLFLQFKRGSWLTCAVILLLFVLVKARWSTRLFGPVLRPVAANWRVVVPALAIALVCIGVTPAVKGRVQSAGKALMERARTERPGKRLCMWLVVTPAIVREHPGGIGWCVLTYDMMRQHCRHVEERRTLHSNLAQVLVATGWLGLAVYLLWMGKALADAMRYASRANRRSPRTEMCAAVLLFMLLGLVLNGLVECNLRKGAITLAYAVTMGAAAAGMIRLRDRSSGRNIVQSGLPD